MQSIIYMVDNDIALQRQKMTDPSASYRISTTHELATAFVKKYQAALDSVSKFAYSISTAYGHTINLTSVVGPYVLLKLGVTDENVSFYLTLGLTISNIICDILAKRHSNKLEQMERKEIVTICETTQKLLEKSQKRNLVHGNPDVQITNSIQEMKKIIESKQ